MTASPIDYHAPDVAGPHWSRHVVCTLLCLLIPLALLEAWWVTPDRDYWKQMDFAVFYTAGRAFVGGHDPYDRTAAEQTWQNAGGDWDVMNVINGEFAGDEANPQDRADHWLPIELVPPGLTVMAPFSLMPEGLAWYVWNYVVAVLFLGQLYATVKLMRRPLWDWASLTAILFTILLEPLHIGLANGQPSVPTISLLVLAVYWAGSHRQLAAGAAFAVATALKPQVAAPFVMLFLFRRQWRTVIVAAGIGAALTWAAAVPMTVAHPHWVHSWAGQVQQAEGSGNIDSARTDNVGRDDLLDLALIGHLFTDNGTVVNTATVGLFFAAVAGLFWAARGRRDELGVSAVFATVTLLAMYHRYYDAGLLVLPVAWALGNVGGRARWAGVAALVVGSAYLFPSEWLVAKFRDAPEATQHRWWFNWLAEPHHAYELLAIAGCAAAGLWLTRSAPPTPAFAPHPADGGWWGRQGVRLSVAFLIPISVLYGWWITPDRDSYKELDFAMYYTASRTFLAGENPYTRWTAYNTWTEKADGDWDVMSCVLGDNPWDEQHTDEYWLPINCIPPALIAFAPFALMKVPHAWPVWNVWVSLLLGLEVLAVARLMRVRLWSAAALWVMVAIALIEPTHIGYANGQPSLPAVSLTAIACWLAVADWQLTAGVVIAVATALKPQLAGPFVLLFLWQRKWRTVGAAAIVGGLMTVGAIVPLMLHDHGPHHLGWLKGWLGEVKYAERPGGVNDARKSNQGRNDMIHLQVLLHYFSDSPMLVNVMTEAVMVALAAVLYRVGRGRQTELATISAFSTLPLLFAYHRLYDAGILVLPIGWAVLHCRGGVGRWPARIILLFAAVYVVSQGVIDDTFFGGADPQGRPIGTGWWFDLFVEAHHQWGLLAIFACLVWTLWRTRATAGRAVGFPVEPVMTATPAMA